MPFRLPIIVASVLLTTASALPGCASASVEIGVTTRAEAYVQLDDPMSLLLAEPPECAILPAIMTGTTPGRGVAADFALDKAMQKDYRPFSLVPQAKIEPFKVLSSHDVVATCIAAKRLETLRSLLASSQPGNLLETKSLQEIGRLMDVDYLLVPQVVGIQTDNASRFTFAGLTFIRTGWISVEGTLQLWHVPTGTLAWQSAGEGSLTAENVVGISPPIQAAMDALFSTLVGDFVTGRTQSVVSGRLKAPPSANPTNATSTTNASTASEPSTSGDDGTEQVLPEPGDAPPKPSSPSDATPPPSPTGRNGDGQ